MYNLDRIEKYIKDFFSTRYEHIDWFYRSTHQQRTYGVYKLKHGTKIMDFVISIHGNVEENLIADKLVPEKFATTDKLFGFLKSFKDYLNTNQPLLDANNEGEDTDMAITLLQEIKDDLVAMIDYVSQLHDLEDGMVPYYELRYALMIRDIPSFIRTMKSVLASVSYSISKAKEGYFHSNVHLILTLLGFHVLSEEETNIGRIDAVIRLSDVIYILEFKFGDNDDLSGEALDQIKEKKYAQKLNLERKEIIGLGISFDEANRNINGFIFEKLSN